MSDAVYSTKVSATGGRHGSIRSDDGLFNLKLALPRTLGGKGDATNPERLFAGGYASSFQNALFHASREARRHFADCDIEVVAQIGLMERPYKGIIGVHRPRGFTTTREGFMQSHQAEVSKLREAAARSS